MGEAEARQQGQFEGRCVVFKPAQVQVQVQVQEQELVQALKAKSVPVLGSMENTHTHTQRANFQRIFFGGRL